MDRERDKVDTCAPRNYGPQLQLKSHSPKSLKSILIAQMEIMSEARDQTRPTFSQQSSERKERLCHYFHFHYIHTAPVIYISHSLQLPKLLLPPALLEELVEWNQVSRQATSTSKSIIVIIISSRSQRRRGTELFLLLLSSSHVSCPFRNVTSFLAPNWAERKPLFSIKLFIAN